MTVTPEEPELFRQAVASLSSLRPRPEIELSDVRAPQRLAPWAFAVAAERCGDHECRREPGDRRDDRELETAEPDLAQPGDHDAVTGVAHWAQNAAPRA